jgi:hypothetical protein
MAEAFGSERIDMRMGGRMGTLAIQGKRGVKFASVVQLSTAKMVNIAISIDSLSLHIITKCLAKPSIACLISRDGVLSPRAFHEVCRYYQVILSMFLSNIRPKRAHFPPPKVIKRMYQHTETCVVFALRSPER